MGFIQTISFSTQRIEEMRALMAEFRAQQGDPPPGFRGSVLLKDRDAEKAYMVLAEFEDFDVAMENSGRPETDAFAKRMAELSEGPPTFGNFDVLDDDR